MKKLTLLSIVLLLLITGCNDKPDSTDYSGDINNLKISIKSLESDVVSLKLLKSDIDSLNKYISKLESMDTILYLRDESNVRYFIDALILFEDEIIGLLSDADTVLRIDSVFIVQSIERTVFDSIFVFTHSNDTTSRIDTLVIKEIQILHYDTLWAYDTTALFKMAHGKCLNQNRHSIIFPSDTVDVDSALRMIIGDAKRMFN